MRSEIRLDRLRRFSRICVPPAARAEAPGETDRSASSYQTEEQT